MKAALIALLAAVVFAGPATAGTDPAARLARKYAPVVRIVAQKKLCGHGEPFLPEPVGVVLGNQEVALRGPWSGANVVKVAPTAHDLARGLFGYHLDFPGNPLSPGCSYEQWEQRTAAHTRPTAYAHVSGDPAHPGRLALQYWFFYVFNDYNDKHEGDWEMIQLDFDASTAARALSETPSEVGYSQHDSAERARWGDKKLEIVDGTHPVVYPAAGSHANYFQSALYLGRSAAQGVGCDDTVGPSRELHPRVDVIPTSPSAYLAAYPWLGFLGHWGEQQPGFYNGPTGPNTKSQWTSPITWADSKWRNSSFTVPEGNVVGTAATDFFCGAIAAGSDLLTSFVGNPWPIVFALIGVLLVLLWLASRTEWRTGTPFRLRRRRAWGELLTSSRLLYTSRPGLFLGIGLLFVPLALVITGIQYLVFRVAGTSSLVDTAGASNAFVAVPALALGILITLLGLTIVQAATALAMVELDEDRNVGPVEAYKLVRPRVRSLVAPLALAALVIALLTLTFFGIPLAIWLLVRWSFLSQVVVLEDHPAFGALRRSGRLVGRRWVHTASVTLLVAGGSLLLGPVAGTILLLGTSASFDFVNLLSSLTYVVTLPFVAIVTTYVYFDLLVHERLAPERAEILPAEI